MVLPGTRIKRNIYNMPLTPVGPGEPAPDFLLKSASGEEIVLSRFKGKSCVVLFFYPKNNTLICTKEACNFRDSYEAFSELGAEVIGISSDPEESHADFASRLGLPFLLLSDPGGEVRKIYGVGKTLGLLPGRVTFIIDRSGVIRHVFSSQLNAKKHVEEALRILEAIRGET
jgi:peroxiredoxin Q/BCP